MLLQNSDRTNYCSLHTSFRRSNLKAPKKCYDNSLTLRLEDWLRLLFQLRGYQFAKSCLLEVASSYRFARTITARAVEVSPTVRGFASQTWLSFPSTLFRSLVPLANNTARLLPIGNEQQRSNEVVYCKSVGLESCCWRWLRHTSHRMTCGLYLLLIPREFSSHKCCQVQGLWNKTDCWSATFLRCAWSSASFTIHSRLTKASGDAWLSLKAH